jgi:hypothetical protein
MAKSMGAALESINGSHVVFIARPDVATALILQGASRSARLPEPSF